MGKLTNIALGGVVSSLMLVAPLVEAAVEDVGFPMLDIQNIGSDAGLYGDASGITIEASLIAQIPSDTDAPITLSGPTWITADFNYADGNEYHYTNGSLTIGDSGNEWLTAEFSDLVLVTSTEHFVAQLSADLLYTGGSLYNNSIDANGYLAGYVASASTLDPTGPFSTQLTALKIGDVAPVPLPASVWFLGAGLMSLVGLRRRQRNAA